jgi:hypothetical protein
LSLSFPQNTVAGDLIVVGFDFDTSATPSSVSDSQGNTFTQVGTQLTSPGGDRSRVYYAKNITGGADTVTVNFSADSSWIEIYLTEYSGVDQTNPIDAQAGASGNAGQVSSGNATTTVVGDVIYGYCVGDWACTVGSGFAARSTFNDNLIEDETAGNPGTYAATGSANNGWTMQMVALKPASSVNTTPPSAPTNLSAAAVSTTQINLSWTASTDNAGVAGYLLERCQGAGCTTFAQIASLNGTTTSYDDTGLTANTSYSYRVRARDAAGNLSSYSNVASATTTVAVAAPVITSATTASGTVGSAFLYQITATNAPTSYGATGLPAGLTVNSGTGLISGTPTAVGTSTVTLGATNSGGTGNTTLTLTIIPTSFFVQAVANDASGTASSLSLSFPQNTVAGDLIVVGFDFDTSATPSSVSDSQGNTFTQVGTQLTSPGGDRSRVYYAKNITGGADTVTVNFSADSSWIEIYLTEYSGVDQTNPIDAQAGASGNAGQVSSGNATTTVVGDVIYGYCVGDWACTVGSGFAARSTFNDNLIEDETAGNPGTYAATGSANNGWTMQMVALKPASSVNTTPPSAPTNLSAAAVSTTQINLSWTASTDNAGVAGYLLERCQGAGCTTFAQIASLNGTTTSYDDTGLTANTSYSYRVRARDAAGNLSSYSNVASATTMAVNNPAPSLTSLSPASAVVGAAPQTLTITGTSFLASSTVTYNGVGHAATFVSSTQLTIGLSATDQAEAGSYAVVVTNPGPGGGASSPLNFTVTGQGPVVGFSSTSLSFGSQYVGDPSTAQLVTLSNTGGAALSFTTVAVTGTNAGDFAQTDTCGSSVAPGGNCTISVTFTPTLTGSETSAVTITDNATNSPQTVTLTGTGVVSAGQLMVLSADKTHLVNTFTNEPVFITGDAPQTISVMLSQADVDTYLADRAARGYNAIWVILIDQHDQTSPPKDYYGNSPFDGAWYTNEDSAYWANQDWVIQQAASYGITVFANISFVGVSGEGYDYSDLLASSDATVQAYGAWLGNRYKNYSNIVWLLGGDTDLTNSGIPSKIADFATGLESADPNHLITFEACRAACSETNSGNGVSALQAYGGTPPSWLNINFVYNTDPTVVSGCQTAFSTAGTLPPLMGEDWYELEHSMTGFQVREEGYWEALSGCYLGRLLGNNAIWSFNSPNAEISGDPAWQTELSSIGSVGEQYLGALMRSREHWLMVPDTTNTYLTAGYGSGSTLSVLSRTSDGQTMIAYIPNGNATTVTINMAGITSSSSMANAWWFNPSSAAATLIGTYANSGTNNFTPPDSNDWVLVIDDASANLAAPGS